MANSIALFKNCVPMLDEVYREASLTSVLDGPDSLVSAGANADELIIPMLDMAGLADYSRVTGYQKGDVTLTHQTVKCNFDRGRMFVVDSLDDRETAGIAFGRLSGEFIRTRVVPELDAFRLSKYASFPGVGGASADLADGEDVIGALRACVNYMDDHEVPQDGRVLFIQPSLRGLVEDMDTVRSRLALSRFERIITVPSTRMYTAISQTGNGYQAASGAKQLNFLCAHRDAVIQYQKHLEPKVVTPQLNQDADAWKFGYRLVGLATVSAAKTAGVYAHSAA